MTDKYKNSVQIQGPVYSCTVSDGSDGIPATARIVVCTASSKCKDGETIYENWQYHRVVAQVSGKTEQRLREISAVCARNREGWGTEGFAPAKETVAVTGRLVTNAAHEPFILADDNAVTFPRTTKMRNTATLKGEVMETTYNDAYASIVMNVGEGTLIPLCLHKDDNPKQWDDVSRGRTGRNDIVEAKGPLMSRTYKGDGDATIFRCSVNTDNIVQQKLRKDRNRKLGF